MSTIDVANLTDAESTTTNSANSSDNLNNTTTVDTKYITNGCAKAWAMSNWTRGIESSLNCSSMTDPATGTQEISITNAFGGGYDEQAIAVSTTTGTCNRIVVVGTGSTSSKTVILRATDAGGATDGDVSFQTHGDLA